MFPTDTLSPFVRMPVTMVDDELAEAGALPDAATPLHVEPVECCRTLAQRIEADLDGLVEAILMAVRDAAPAYRELTGNALEAVRFGVTGTTSLLLRTLREDRGLVEGEIAELEALGEQRARQGVPLEGLHAATRAAHAAGFEYLHAEFLATAEEWTARRVDLLAAARHLALHTQEFRTAQWAAFERGYRRPDAIRVVEARRDFLASLLAGSFATDADVISAAERCDSVLATPTVLIVVAAPTGNPGNLRKRVVALTPMISTGLVSATADDPHPHVVAVVPLSGHTWDEFVSTLAPRLEEAGLVGVAEPAMTLTELAPVYKGLRQRISIVGRLRSDSRVLRAFDLTLAWAASQPDDDARFLDIDTVVGPMLARRRDRARRDLEALTALRAAHGNFAVAARQLGVQAKEVRRKLREIERRCRLDLANPTDLAALGWALSLYWADPDSLPPLGDPAWGRSSRANHAMTARRVD